LRIHEQKLRKLAFQQVPQRPPVLACGLHRDLGDLAVLQPGPHLLEVSRIGPELPLPHFDVRLTQRSQHAHRDAVLMHVDAATAATNLLHKMLLSSDRRAKNAWDNERHSYACSSAPKDGDNSSWFQ
jgi:hypothetical protein